MEFEKGQLFQFVKDSAVRSSLKNTQRDCISVNRRCKACMRKESQKWYASQVQAQITKGMEPEEVAIDLKISTRNPQYCQ